MLINSFKTLLAPWCDAPDVGIKGLTLDSRTVEKGDVFVAIKGLKFDGHDQIENAIAKGAVAVIAQAKQANAKLDYQQNVPIAYLPDLEIELSAIAGRFYQTLNPQSSLSVIGVTGTNGKTTITQLIAQWLDLLAKPCAVIGTTGNGFLSNLIPSPNTTPDALSVHQKLAQFTQMGAQHVAMEVSSHGLTQHRVKAINFAAVVFSNLTRDHLDYHGSMQAYESAKLSLFTEFAAPVAVINADDQVGHKWLQALPNAVAVSMSNNEHLVNAKKLWLTKVNYTDQGIEIAFDSSWGAGHFSTPLVGEFNVMNLLLSLATLLAMGFDKEKLLAVAHQLKAVIGRMEIFRANNKPLAVVDYAHTPDALEKALLALRRHCMGKLWCVFGCGGDRDSGKRPIMASVAEQHADRVILTNDNPRNEAPDKIIQDMVAGMRQAERVDIILDRFDACQYAFEHADKQDIILIAGKGHENYQLFANDSVHYSDRETVQQLMEKV